MSKICLSCGSIIKNTKTVTPGSFFIELILWCAFIVPGLCYSFWRLASKHAVCPQCSSKNIVPLNSPIGLKLQKNLEEK